MKIGCLFKSLYLEKKPHYSISNLFLIVLLYIVEYKKGCKKKSLNIFSLAADLLKSGICLLIASVPVHCFSITFLKKRYKTLGWLFGSHDNPLTHQ